MSTATTPPTEIYPPVSELSLSPLLDAVERKVDGIAKGYSPIDSATLEQVDDTISRISEISRKAKNIKNSLVSINKIPPETLALVAAFLGPGRQLINATAVCQHWRTTLLSFPRLWNRINCSTKTMYKAYLKRSKSAPLQVRLRNTAIHWLELLIPHTSQLSSLTVVMYDSSGFEEFARHLGSQISALNQFSIIAAAEVVGLALPSSTENDKFLHVKKLHLERLPSFRAICAFPHVTELVWIVRSHSSVPVSSLLDTMVELIALERVEIVFERFRRTPPIPRTPLVTLPKVQRMSLHCSDGEIPYFLGLLELPSLTSLVVSGVPNLSQSFEVLPVASFGQSLPNLSQLPEMEIAMHHNRVSFRSSSQATLDHSTKPRPLGREPKGSYPMLWGGLPVDSVRKLVVGMDMRTTYEEGLWMVALLSDLRSLEHLELRGHCGDMLWTLGRAMMCQIQLPCMKTLTARSGSKYLITQALKLKDVVDRFDLGIDVIWIQDLDIPGDEEWEPEWATQVSDQAES